MSSYINIVVLVEGTTEKFFIEKIIAPYLINKSIIIQPIIISKPGQKGGDVRFDRVKNDIELHLKQRKDTYLTLFVDYYGIKPDWPGYKASVSLPTSKAKSDFINQKTSERVIQLYTDYSPERRFIPYIGIHEFEALLFCDTDILSTSLNIKKKDVDSILKTFGTPEEINNDPNTAPSKRLERLSNQFKKTANGIEIVNSIGLDKIRSKCPIFNSWIVKIETLK